MHGKVCLVSGASSGIGRATARELAARGAEVVLVGRDPERCAASAAALRAATGNGAVTFLVADLSSLVEVRRVAAEFRARHGRLDVLVNNVGGVFRDFGLSAEGIERTWALNHLGPFLLTALLEDALRSAPAGRVVTVASSAHRGVQLDFADLEGRARYRAWRAYRRSKLANLLFAYELARRLSSTRVTSNALHPGVVATSLSRSAPLAWLKRALVGVLSIPPEEGARTSVHVSCAPELAGVSGAYFVRERPARSSPASYDLDAARRLWDASRERCGP